MTKEAKLIEQQRIRKANLKQLINEQFNGNVEDFARALEKHKNFIYSLLWDVANPNSRKLTDKMCRLIELNLNVQPGYLDKIEANTYISTNSFVYIKYLDIFDSQQTRTESVAEELSFPIQLVELDKNGLNAVDLIAVRVFDNTMQPYCNFDDTLIIDKSFVELRENHYYLINYGNKFYTRRLATNESNEFIFVAENNLIGKHKPIDVELNKNNLEIFGIVVFRFLNSEKFMR